jgi:serine/threonine-protein kinase SRPK3
VALHLRLLGRAMIPLVLDSFTILGSSGSHPCYVTKLGTEDLLSITDSTRTGMHNLDVSSALAAQLVLAVAYIHSQGFVHGGSRR